MRILVFTDLDGTLLDHASYDYTPALPAIAALQDRNIPLILASSKTAAEMSALHRALNLGGAPSIVENGAGVVWPGQPQSASDDDYRTIRGALDALPSDLRIPFSGFGDMGRDGIVAATGLSPEAAEAAALRQFTEPGQWTGDTAGLTRFLAALSGQGITARRGGRFLTLSLGRTKAQAMTEVAKRLKADVTIALGDAPNDAEMIETADHGVVVRNDHGAALPHLAGEDEGRIMRTTEPGPVGWNAAVLALLDQLDDSRGTTDG